MEGNPVIKIPLEIHNVDEELDIDEARHGEANRDGEVGEQQNHH